MPNEYEVVVVGAGHAGCEAALAAARLGLKTLLTCTQLESIAFMACNPSVGGPGKSHLVHEVEALGGEMGKIADIATLSRRILNRRKGPAVRALRVQVDKGIYQQAMRRALEREDNLHLCQTRVDRVLVENGVVRGIATQSGLIYRCQAVIVATGVYLEARVFMGEIEEPGGPNGLKAAEGLSRSLEEAGLEWKRFRTTTPPRVSRRSLELEAMEEQVSEDVPGFTSREGSAPGVKDALSCWLTRTNRRTHAVIAQNRSRSLFNKYPLEGGEPRYCPSIEDKVVRFAHRESHQIFLEPEGWDTDEYYVMGMFTSLPEEVQMDALRTMDGMERVQLLRPGYGIEYDVMDPAQLDAGLQAKRVRGLFFAGQVNGTSGYEEAAGQGLLAGINSARQLRGQNHLILDRAQAYLGVMVDDLVTRGVMEPYRMLTSRAEYRLLLRPDNAGLRLREVGGEIGLVDELEVAEVRAQVRTLDRVKKDLDRRIVQPAAEINCLLEGRGETPLQEPTSARDLLRRPAVAVQDLRKLGLVEKLDEGIMEMLETEVKYQGYIERQQQQVHRFRQLEERRLPEDLFYSDIPGLSREACEKLNQIRPRSVGQANRIAGVTPADISLVLVALEKMRRGGSPNAGSEAMDRRERN